MNGLSRRRFMSHGSLGVAVAGALAVVPGLSAVLKMKSPAIPTAPLPLDVQRSLAGPLVAHVRDLNSGEISLMVGTEHVVQRDRDLAARLYSAVQRARR